MSSGGKFEMAFCLAFYFFWMDLGANLVLGAKAYSFFPLFYGSGLFAFFFVAESWRKK